MRLGALLLFLGGVLAAEGCADERHETLRDELRRARAMWASRAVTDYDMTLFRLQQTVGGTVVVRVRDREIVAREEFDDLIVSPPAGTNRGAFVARHFPDVEGLFGEIRDAIDGEADGIDVTYHPEAGYPVEARIDWIAPAVDDETSFAVHELRIVRPTGSGEAP